jgi:hypothetical protein
MDFYAVLDQVVALLQSRGRVSYRALKLQFQLDDEAMEALQDELIHAQQLAADEDGKVLVWRGGVGTTPAPESEQTRTPLSYTPTHLAEKILTSKTALEGERKQVTVLFADLKGSMELLADRMWTHVDACLYALNTLTDAGKRGLWLRSRSYLCIDLWDPGGIYMPSA